MKYFRQYIYCALLFSLIYISVQLNSKFQGAVNHTQLTFLYYCDFSLYFIILLVFWILCFSSAVPIWCFEESFFFFEKLGLLWFLTHE
jgi:hypothetical protein